MYTLGSSFIPSANHAGGLRYHGMSGIVSQLYDDGYLEATSVEQTKVFEAAEQFARVEGILLPAPESSHAIRVAIDEALKCKETGEEKNIVFGLTGTGYFDLVAYQRFNDGEMTDRIPTDEEIAASLAKPRRSTDKQSTNDTPSWLKRACRFHTVKKPGTVKIRQQIRNAFYGIQKSGLCVPYFRSSLPILSLRGGRVRPTRQSLRKL